MIRTVGRAALPRLADHLGVLQAELQGIHADRLGHLLHVRLDGERRLQVAVAAERAGVGVVGIDRLEAAFHRRHPEMGGEGPHHHVRHRRPPGGMGILCIVVRV